MAMNPTEPHAYTRLGQVGARSPVVIAVPHAGRQYPPEMLAASRLPQAALETIEDRYADLLVTDAVADGAVAIVARMARAYIDLNRDEREIDPQLLADCPGPGDVILSPKVTGGLGVIPSRIAMGGLVWKRPLSNVEVEARMATAHRPYHAAIEAAMDEAQATHGTAILLDCHSMPALAGRPVAPQMVIGDRHGRSASGNLVMTAVEAARTAGLIVTRNHPYAGGHTLDRHGQPRRGRHAIQIEIDRTLYLDQLSQPGAGLARMQQVLARIAAALEDELRGHALAAE